MKQNIHVQSEYFCIFEAIFYPQNADFSDELAIDLSLNLLPQTIHVLYHKPMIQIETFPNPAPEGRRYRITHTNPEFTSVCPKTGLPDFGTITVHYVPDKTCIELKSLKYYFLDFRNKGIFYEAVTNQILDDLVAACDPFEMEIVADWMPRGGISSRIVASHKRP